MNKLHDSGDRKEFLSGAVRDRRAGKGRFDLLPVFAMFRLARHFEAGAEKYTDRNWEKGMPVSVYMDAAQRHIMEYLVGLDDEDHLAAAMWNVACAMDTLERINLGLLPKELDDTPKHLNGYKREDSGSVVTALGLLQPPVPEEERTLEVKDKPNIYDQLKEIADRARVFGPPLPLVPSYPAIPPYDPNSRFTWIGDPPPESNPLKITCDTSLPYREARLGDLKIINIGRADNGYHDNKEDCHCGRCECKRKSEDE